MNEWFFVESYYGSGEVVSLDGQHVCRCRYSLSFYQEMIDRELPSGRKKFEGQISERIPFWGEYALIIEDGRKIQFWQTSPGVFVFTGGLNK